MYKRVWFPCTKDPFVLRPAALRGFDRLQKCQHFPQYMDICLFVCLLLNSFFFRAKWFELMNTEEEEVDEEEGQKRKREEGDENSIKVKKIKLKIARW